jgi:hypothetical protein
MRQGYGLVDCVSNLPLLHCSQDCCLQASVLSSCVLHSFTKYDFDHPCIISTTHKKARET